MPTTPSAGTGTLIEHDGSSVRILIANTRHYRRGGDSTYTFALAEALRSANHEVGFFAMAGSRNEPDPNEDLFVSHIDFRDLNRVRV